MPNEQDEQPPHRTSRSLLRISSTDDPNATGKSVTTDRPSVFSWRDDSCWSVSENTKSRDFRRKRFKKQKGEYLAAKMEPPPEVLSDLQQLKEEEEREKAEEEANRASEKKDRDEKKLGKNSKS
ncbi:unnamed protein product [Calicophoron daubneyi]|uniref:Uncharacterized protein n=1 Tax=Calicophoron daubneyi TaxID=300641 RepID=A0AAV2TNP4_CALDB